MSRTLVVPVPTLVVRLDTLFKWRYALTRVLYSTLSYAGFKPAHLFLAKAHSAAAARANRDVRVRDLHLVKAHSAFKRAQQRNVPGVLDARIDFIFHDPRLDTISKHRKVASALAVEAKKDPKHLHCQVWQHLQAGDLPLAKDALLEAYAKRVPDLDDLTKRCLAALHYRGAHTELATFAEVLAQRHDPRYYVTAANAWVAVAESQASARDALDRALNNYHSAIDADIPGAQLKLARFYFAAGEYQLAAVAWEKSYETNQSPDTLYNAIGAWLKADSPEKADELIAKAMATHSSSRNLNGADFLHEQGHSLQAATIYAAVGEKTNNVELLTTAAAWFEEAATTIETLDPGDPENPENRAAQYQAKAAECRDMAADLASQATADIALGTGSYPRLDSPALDLV